MELRRGSHRRLLSILALDGNRRLATDVLIDRYWGEQVPATAKAVLQTHISALRKLLGADLIVTEGYGYRLDLSAHAFDAEEFEALTLEARQAIRARRWERTLASSDTALALWRGTPYEELRDDDFARFEISRLEELQLELLEVRAEALVGLGREREAVVELEQLVGDHPLRERLWEQWMTALYRLGRHADALSAYRRAWAAFAELGIEPSSALRRLERKILLHDEAIRGGLTPNNLPTELTRFIGRTHELSELSALLDGHRLVTLVGVGGAGKTRLALEAASGCTKRFPDGVWLSDLGRVRGAEHVPLEVARVVGLRPRGDVVEELLAAIGRDTVLILLDNCEHVVEAAASLAGALLERCQGLVLLATSRQPLRVPGEVVYEVPPMSFPADAEGDIRNFDAVELFADRARLARPSFVLDASNSAAVARVCRRLDGIPLAIEFAAARVGALSPETIAERLDRRFSLLTSGSATGPERHQTLEATFAWSYDLLDDDERVVFARLGIFSGGFTLEMAEDVCAGGGVERVDVVPVVVGLIEKSLVSSYGDEERVRYHLLETVREYALARLDELGATGTLRAAHLGWCVRFSQDVNARVYGTGRAELFARLNDESENLQAALESSRAHGSGDATRALARALAWHWWSHGQLGQHGRVFSSLETALAHCSDALEEAEIRALVSAAHEATGDTEDAFQEGARAYELVADLAPSLAKVWVLQRHAALPLHADRDPVPTVTLCRAALAEARATGDPVAEIRVRWMLGWALSRIGEADAGVDQYRVAHELALGLDDPVILLDTLLFSFEVLYLHPELRRSEPRRRAEEVLSRPGERWSTHAHRHWLAFVFLQSGEWDLAHAIVDRLGRRFYEGYHRAAHHIVRATLRWMRGALDDAGVDLATLGETGVHPRWHHHYYPLLADVRADQGRVEDARRTAEEYLALAVDRTQESRKLGVLAPLARAEVEAAFATSGSERAEHVERARGAVNRGQEILGAFPPLAEGSLQMETPRTYLALAEAELSRAAESDPELWRAVAKRADFAYFRLYARFRLAEALLATDSDEGAEELRAAHADARAMGAHLLRRQLEQLATARRLTLTKQTRGADTLPG
jgi:predicted ATPase/DNA-binding SARP family transcriptional activator